MSPLFGPSSGLVLFGAFLFHPVDGLAVEPLLNGDMRHGRGAVPMFLPRLEPDHVPRPNVLDRTPQRWTRPRPSVTIRVWRSLVAVPGGASAGLERDTSIDRAGRSGCLEQGVN